MPYVELFLVFSGSARSTLFKLGCSFSLHWDGHPGFSFRASHYDGRLTDCPCCAFMHPLPS